MAIQTADPAFNITYGAMQTKAVMRRHGVDISLAMPWLAGRGTEALGAPGSAIARADPFIVAEMDGQMTGVAIVPASEGLEGAAEKLYRKLLAVCGDFHLHRVWNYVPQINEYQAGLERYQQFNIGRWVAFEERFGRDLRSYMPAASAVGIGGDQLAVMFSAGRKRPVFFENPSQVPAYHYPPDYGPRPPGFARGVVIEEPDARTIFLSGTASIEGHRSIGAGDWALQFRTMMHNIETMMDRMEVPAALDVSGWRHGEILEGRLTCYLRHPESLSVMQEWLQEQTGLAEEQISYVQADICRAELDMEIEATIRVAPRASS